MVVTKSTLELKPDKNLLECSVEENGVGEAEGSAPETRGTTQLHRETANNILKMG